ncbi:MAG: GLPGLI family protein [Kaistella sp.]
MKKSFLILFILILNISSAQTRQFIYEYISARDSTQKDSLHSEMMVLNIAKDKSDYFSLDQYVSDSTLLADSKKGLMTMPLNKKMNNDRIIKTSNSADIKFITRIGHTKYYVDEKPHFKWTLHPEYINILNYKAQKATTHFGGRTWTAWFTQDIPLQDGPYKFKDLPGLIVKIEDETKSHQFELKGIKNINNDIIYPELNNYSKIHLSSRKYIKAYQNYRENPAAELVGKFPDQRDAEGNFKKGIEIFREFEKHRKNEVKKDNNIIEIDLIKS